MKFLIQALTNTAVWLNRPHDYINIFHEYVIYIGIICAMLGFDVNMQHSTLDEDTCYVLILQYIFIYLVTFIPSMYM